MPSWRDRLTEYQRDPNVLPQLSNLAAAMCAPFWWSLQRSPGERATILNNGSVCFVNTGQSELGVSASHVMQKYVGHLAKYRGSAIECQFGGSTISPEKRLIDENNNRDLVTL